MTARLKAEEVADQLSKDARALISIFRGCKLRDTFTLNDAVDPTPVFEQAFAGAADLKKHGLIGEPVQIPTDDIRCIRKLEYRWTPLGLDVRAIMLERLAEEAA